jgi:diaminopimelate epimerase
MLIEHSDLFIEKTNVEFAEVISDTEIKLRVWERGTGITKACGSGACATFVAARTLGLIKNNYCDITLEGGKLYISSDKNCDIYMNGEATFVFSGSIEIKDV